MARTMTLRRWMGGRSAERGSIPMALLATIVAGGLVTVVLAVTLAGERATLFDQNFTGSLHTAEEGAQEALHLLNTGQLAPRDSGEWPDSEGEGDADGNEQYRWTAVAFLEAGDGEYESAVDEDQEGVNFHELDLDERDIARWRITSHGTAGDVERVVEMEVSVQPLFDLAVFTDQDMALGGNNLINSYHSGNEEWCTGAGRVGSNAEIEGFSGHGGGGECDPFNEDGDPDEDLVGDITNDGVDLYNWESNENPDRCGGQDSHQSPNNCWWDEETPRYDTHDQYRDTDPSLDSLDEALSDGGCDFEETYVVSDEGDPAGDADPYTIDPAGAEHPSLPWDPDTNYYCVGGVEFDVDTTIAGSSKDPVVFVTDGDIEVSNSGTVINCETDDGVCEEGNKIEPSGDDNEHGAVYPDAGGLQLYTGSDSDQSVFLSAKTVLAASVFAPETGCGTQGGGQGGGGGGIHIFGSWVCDEVTNAGNFEFHYDEALTDLMLRPNYGVSTWREEEL